MPPSSTARPEVGELFQRLPGPVPVRILIVLVAVVVLLVALNFLYTWMGDTFLDSGGGIG